MYYEPSYCRIRKDLQRSAEVRKVELIVLVAALITLSLVVF